MYGDELRDSNHDNPREINMDASNRKFVQEMKDKKWILDEICFDYFRMMDSYSTNRLSKSFFENIKGLAGSGVLRNNARTKSGKAEIYLPFMPHFFFHVHGMRFEDHYTVEYVTEKEYIANNSNALFSATKSYTT